MDENSSIQALFPTLVYHANEVTDEEKVKEIREAMDAIDIGTFKVPARMANEAHEEISKAFFGDAENFKNYGIPTEWLFSQVKTHVQSFLEEMGVPANRYDAYVQKWWPVITQRGGIVSRHTHHNAHLSVVYYVDVPNAEDGPNGYITFYANSEFFSRRIGLGVDDHGHVETFVNFLPQTGDLLIFPANLEHAVSPNEQDKKRFSISMDLMLIRTDLNDEKHTDEMCLPALDKWKKL